MCGRFALLPNAAVIEDIFGVPVEAFPPRYNIAPTQPILVIAGGMPREPGSNQPDRMSMLVRWGFIPGWVKDVSQFPLLINARSETAATKASFRAAMRHRRVLIPASGFYEWKRTGRKNAQPYWVRPTGEGVVAFGGLMETYAEPGGSEIDTAAILTTGANSQIAHIHDRMPVVIRPEHYARWLDCVGNEPRDVADIMEPVEPGFFETIPVSDKVNKVANAGPDIQEPVEVLQEEPQPDDAQKPDDQLTLF
ncbi:SOS response-associated peptidase [Mesorhizobium sp. CAU 1741]|uniref:SOS response-associated peptidase n=1 Tax=Mesorhizobium sp. CAU 1741 TaxID=3140366 RepID=UPI00325B5A4C